MWHHLYIHTYIHTHNNFNYSTHTNKLLKEGEGQISHIESPTPPNKALPCNLKLQVPPPLPLPTFLNFTDTQPTWWNGKLSWREVLGQVVEVFLHLVLRADGMEAWQPQVMGGGAEGHLHQPTRGIQTRRTAVGQRRQQTFLYTAGQRGQRRKRERGVENKPQALVSVWLTTLSHANSIYLNLQTFLSLQSLLRLIVDTCVLL